MTKTDTSDKRYDVLYVEDNDDNIFVMELRLSVLPRIDLRVATTGEEARQAWSAGRPDLVLMDISLPDTDGKTLIRQLRSHPELLDVPVIVLTASAMEEDRQACLDAGADLFETKPVDFNRLFVEMAMQLGDRDLRA